VLEIGNFLNSHNDRMANAVGYRLDTLLCVIAGRSVIPTCTLFSFVPGRANWRTPARRLHDARSPADKSVTLLHWLIRHCERERPGALNQVSCCTRPLRCQAV
jgi:hypothetical protein